MLMATLDALDKGRRGVVAVVKELDDLVPGVTASDRRQANGFKLSDIKKNYDENLGAGDLTDTGNKWLNRGIGLAGDLALDPLSYATLGIASGTKKAASGAARLTKGRKTAQDVAREALEAGDRELAERVMSRGRRGSVNALSAEEAAAYGLRQGPTVGLGKARVAVPKGDVLARTVSDVLAKSGATTKLAKTSVGTGLAAGLKTLSPLERMIARDANRALRLQAKGTKAAAMTSLNRIVQEAGGSYDAARIRDSIEGVGAPDALGSRITQTLDDVHAWASQMLGRELPRRENYLSHRLDDEAKAMKGDSTGARKGKTPTVLKQRGHQAGDVFYGQVLKDGSISEMNRIFRAATGRTHNYWEDDPVKIAKQYIEDLTTMVARSEEAFATEAIARTGRGGDAPLREVIPSATKEARREVKELDKTAAQLTDKLDKARTELKGAQAGARLADSEAQARVRDANLLAQGGNPAISKAADDYVRRAGLPPITPVDRTLRVNDQFAAQVAKAYDDLPMVDPAAEPAYRAMVEETKRQFEYITRELKIKVQMVDVDPYKTAEEMMADIKQNKTLKVYKTAGEQLHPFLSPEENDMFRAVHDFFGHAHAGNKFDRHGEEVAYRLHSQMYGPEARKAMATETRGQNSYLNYAEENVARRARGERAEFPVQKAALLPDEMIGAMPSGVAQAVPEGTLPGLLGTIPDLKTRRAALLAAAGRDTTKASDELIRLTGAVRLEGQETLGEQAFLIPSTGQVVPERNIVSHVDAALQIADLKERRLAASADVAAKLRPQVAEAARTVDPVFIARDAEALADAAADNAKKLDIISAVPISKDKLRVEAFKRAEAERLFREDAQRLYDEAARLRAAGDDEMANIAALEAQARQIEADLTDLDKKWTKAMAKAGDVRYVNDLHAMMAQGLAQLADGRFAEPWVADAAKQLGDAMTPANVGRLIKEFDRISGWWRASALLSPGYHGRNAFGGMFNNMLAGMDWARYPEYRRTLKQYKAGGVEGIKDPTLREAWRAAEANGLLGGEDISDVTKLIGKEGGHIVGRQNPLFQYNFKVASRVEASLRMPLFVDAFVKNGGNVDSAMDSVMRYHFDYDDLSKIEREVGRRAFGFYTWARNNLPLMMAEMADSPGKFTRYSHLKRNMELGQEEDPQKPGYFNKLMAIAIPGAKWSGQQIYWAPDLPFISAAGTAGEGYAGLLSNLNPLIKTPLETVTNRKFFENRNFSDSLRPGPSDPIFGTVLQVMARLPKGIPGVPKVYRGKDGSVLIDEREMNKIESMLPMLSRLRRLYPSEEKYQERALTSWLSFAFGIGARTLDESMRGGEMARRKEQAQKQERRQAVIEGGKRLADLEAAERQARAIKLAQEGRTGR